MSATEMLRRHPSYVEGWKEAIDSAEEDGSWILDTVNGVWDIANISETEYLELLRLVRANEDPEVPETFILVSLRS